PLRRAPLLQPGATDAARRRSAQREDVEGDVSSHLRVRPVAWQGAGGGAGQLRLHREPAARPLSARCHSRRRARCRERARYRQSDAARLWLPDGPAHAARLRGARHDLQDRRDHVHRVPRAALRAAPAPQAHGPRRPWIAAAPGLQAEDVIEHGEAIHGLTETHEPLGLVTMGIFAVVLAWKLFRRAKLGGAEEAVLRLLSLAALARMVWTARIGGK